MMELFNRVRGMSGGMDMMNGQNRWGVVTAVRASDQGYDARVTLQPDGIGSAWLPVLTAFGGSGWGMVARPSVGMQVLVVPDLGDGHHGIIVGMAYSSQSKPPTPPNDFQQSAGTPVAEGEWAVVSKAGAVLRLCSDGTVFLHASTLKVDGNLLVQGNITAQGNVYATLDPRSGTGGDVFDRHGTLETERNAYNHHVHPNNGFPTPQVPE